MKERQKVDNSIRQKVKDKNFSQVGSSTSHTTTTNLHKKKKKNILKHFKTLLNNTKQHLSEREREREILELEPRATEQARRHKCVAKT